MKSEKKILTAFILNLAFSVFETIGGIYTGSIAVISDAVHDMGDAFAIGLSYCFEKKSKKQPDEVYSYGYARFSVLGGFITSLLLVLSCVFVIINAVCRIIEPVKPNYNGMIVFALIGVAVNSVAAFFTRAGESLNRKAVNLHMLEDVLGWITVLVGAIIMRFTGIVIIDPVMSVAVALFILVNAVKNIKEVIDIFLEKTPEGIDIGKIREKLCEIETVSDAHHIHIRRMNVNTLYATMHIVVSSDIQATKEAVKEKLREYGIVHSTLEIETEGEHCSELQCKTGFATKSPHHHCH